MEGGKIKSFSDLNAWQEAYRLTILIYRITENFPQKEVFGLISQLRRAAVSVASNIAEGFSRETNKDKKHFYITSKGSVIEIQNQLLISRGIGYLDEKSFQKVAKQTIMVHKLINGLINKVKLFEKQKLKNG